MVTAAASSAKESTPLPFTGFCQLVNLQLTTGQAAFAAVAYDGRDPEELPEPAREVARRIFGNIDTVPATARPVIVQVKGRDVGGSRLGAVRLLHLALTIKLEGRVEADELAFCIFTGPKLRHARVGLRFALSAARRIRGLRVEAEASDGFTVVRHDGRRVRLECFAAARGGDTGRGVPIVGALLDEAGFYFDESTGAVNDAAIFSALVPRLLPGGQILIVSSPWAESGLLYTEFQANHGKPTTALAAFCPTLAMRDDPETAATVARERARDPVNARREFDAEFLPTGADSFFDSRAIDAAIDASILLPAPPTEGAVRTAGGDLGFVHDSSALVLVERDPFLYRVAHVVEIRPTAGPLKPSAVVASFAGEMRPYEIDTLTADSHYRQSVEEHLEEHRMYLAPAPEGATGKADTYQVARALINEGLVKLPAHERLIQQLKAVSWRPTPGGGVSISSPRMKGGGHGDLVSALVLALWRASLETAPEVVKPGPTPGSPEWFNAQEAERISKWEATWRASQDDDNDPNAWILGAS